MDRQKYHFDTYVYYLSLPYNVHEVILPCLDGYTIYINVFLDDIGREKAYRHAVKHIELGDWQKYSVQQLEMVTHSFY